MILPGVSMAEMTLKGKMMATNVVGHGWFFRLPLPSQFFTLYCTLCLNKNKYFTRVAGVPSWQILQSASFNQLAVLLFNLSTVGKRTFPVSGANFWNILLPHVIATPQ